MKRRTVSWLVDSSVIRFSLILTRSRSSSSYSTRWCIASHEFPFRKRSKRIVFVIVVVHGGGVVIVFSPVLLFFGTFMCGDTDVRASTKASWYSASPG